MIKILMVFVSLLLTAMITTAPLQAADERNLDIYAQLEELRTRIEGLGYEIELRDDSAKRIFLMRLQQAESEHTRLLHEHAAKILKQKASAGDDFVLDPRFAELMRLEPANIRSILRLNTRSIALPTGGETASELAAVNASMKVKLSIIDAWYNALLKNLELSRALGLNIDEEEWLLEKGVRERAANASSYLALALQDVAALKERAALLSEDKEIQSLYLVETDLVTTIARELEIVVRNMAELGLDSSQYKSQLITATGSISTDVFTFDVIATLVRGWTYSATNWLRANGGTVLFNLSLFVIILLVSRILSRWVKRGTETALRYSTTPISTLLQRMLVSTASSSVYLIGVLIALSQVGISLGPLLTGLGIAGFVIGFALQDTLSNFASGMMILFYRPFDVGDVIDADGIFGEVSAMSLVNTTILTFDNQTLIVPNSKIWGNVIKNVTAQTKRRVDLIFGIGYGDDIVKTETVLKRILDEHELVLDDPAPIIKVHELGDSAVNFAVRPWVNTKDYWTVYWDLTRTVKLKFDEEGISIPYPQRDIHLHQNATS